MLKRYGPEIDALRRNIPNDHISNIITYGQYGKKLRRMIEKNKDTQVITTDTGKVYFGTAPRRPQYRGVTKGMGATKRQSRKQRNAFNTRRRLAPPPNIQNLIEQSWRKPPLPPRTLRTTRTTRIPRITKTTRITRPTRKNLSRKKSRKKSSR